ncbi:MAG: thermonuclease family protein [Rhizobiaceae bacterium]
MAQSISFRKHRRARAQRRRGGIRRALTRIYGFAALAAVVGIGIAASGALPPLDRFTHDPLDGIVSLWQPPEPEVVTSRHFPICSSGARVDCIVDGDTFWIGGEKVRIADIDTPEISEPKCRGERELGEQAKRRLHQLMNAGPVELRRSGSRDTDRYGRLLRTVHRNGRSLGDILVSEGLAHRWSGRRESWCG